MEHLTRSRGNTQLTDNTLKGPAPVETAPTSRWAGVAQSIRTAPSSLFTTLRQLSPLSTIKNLIQRAISALSATPLFNKMSGVVLPEAIKVSRDSSSFPKMSDDIQILLNDPAPPENPSVSKQVMFNGKELTVNVPHHFATDFHRSEILIKQGGSDQIVPGTGSSASGTRDECLNRALETLLAHVQGNLPVLERLLSMASQDGVPDLVITRAQVVNEAQPDITTTPAKSTWKAVIGSYEPESGVKLDFHLKSGAVSFARDGQNLAADLAESQSSISLACKIAQDTEKGSKVTVDNVKIDVNIIPAHKDTQTVALTERGKEKLKLALNAELNKAATAETVNFAVPTIGRDGKATTLQIAIPKDLEKDFGRMSITTLNSMGRPEAVPGTMSGPKNADSFKEGLGHLLSHVNHDPALFQKLMENLCQATIQAFTRVRVDENKEYQKISENPATPQFTIGAPREGAVEVQIEQRNRIGGLATNDGRTQQPADGRKSYSETFMNLSISADKINVASLNYSATIVPLPTVQQPDFA